MMRVGVVVVVLVLAGCLHGEDNEPLPPPGQNHLGDTEPGNVTVVVDHRRSLLSFDVEPPGRTAMVCLGPKNDHYVASIEFGVIEGTYGAKVVAENGSAPLVYAGAAARSVDYRFEDGERLVVWMRTGVMTPVWVVDANFTVEPWNASAEQRTVSLQGLPGSNGSVDVGLWDVAMRPTGRVLDRVQVFAPNGSMVEEWTPLDQEWVVFDGPGSWRFEGLAETELDLEFWSMEPITHGCEDAVEEIVLPASAES